MHYGCCCAATACQQSAWERQTMVDYPTIEDISRCDHYCRLCCWCCIEEAISLTAIKLRASYTSTSIFLSLPDMQNGSCHGPRETKIPHQHSSTTTTSGAIILSGGVASSAATANGSVTVSYLNTRQWRDSNCSTTCWRCVATGFCSTRLLF